MRRAPQERPPLRPPRFHLRAADGVWEGLENGRFAKSSYAVCLCAGAGRMSRRIEYAIYSGISGGSGPGSGGTARAPDDSEVSAKRYYI